MRMIICIEFSRLSFPALAGHGFLMTTTLILGGARSGKTAYALSLAVAPRTYVATAQALDTEMADRIARHKAERGEDWSLIEAPLALPDAIRGADKAGETLLIDCLTLWLSNLLYAQQDISEATEDLLSAIKTARAELIFVSNEIGLGLVPMEALSRQFRDAQGTLNQAIASASDRVFFVAAGLPLTLK